MSLENELKKNTEALIANTNALAANEKGTTPVTTQPVPAQASPAASAPTPAPTPEVTVDVLDDVPAAGGVLDDVPASAPVAPAGEILDKKQIIAAVIALAKAKGREAASAFMAKYGVSKASEFNDPTIYVDVLAALTAATQAK